MNSLESIYNGKRILVTGHTGFKGAWLCEWLLSLGAKVHGFSLPPTGAEPLFSRLDLSDRIDGHFTGDISQGTLTSLLIEEIKPQFVFHLAGQSLVRRSYQIPVETFATNVMGTVNLLDAIMFSQRPCTVVAVTTDKVYYPDTRRPKRPFRETDRLGGRDPYSASKAAAELAIEGYRHAFFDRGDVVRVASARAGNVIGGGDWCRDRIVPDFFRALRRGEPVQVRNPDATRPWQHVLDCLSGYLWLGAMLMRNGGQERDLHSAYNFGPPYSRTVGELIGTLADHCRDKPTIELPAPDTIRETASLAISPDKSRLILGWEPTLSFEETVRMTAEWYLQDAKGTDMGATTRSQIAEFQAAAAAQDLIWSRSR